MKKKGLIIILSLVAAVAILTTSIILVVKNGGEQSSSSIVSEMQSSSDQDREVLVSLNSTSAEMEIYSTLQLTADVQNASASQIVWESSNNSVLTVEQNGRVTALGVGEATVTASIGEVSAVCEIKVIKGSVAPVLSVSTRQLGISVGESFSVTASTSWNGRKLEGVTYNWYLADEQKTQSETVSVETANGGSVATFKALAKGSEVYVVSTEVNGYVLVEEITVNAVENDIYFEVSNMQAGKGGYYTAISLTEAEGYITGITPDIKVFVAGEQKTDVSFKWTNSNPEVASMSASGEILAFKAGVTVLTAEVLIDGKQAFFNLTVEVFAPDFNYEITEIKEIDLNAYGITATINFGSEIASKIDSDLVLVTLDGAVLQNCSYQGGKLSLEMSALGNIYKERTLKARFEKVENDKVIYTQTVELRVKAYRAISTVEQFNSMESYVQMDGTQALGDFRLVKDIDFKGAVMTGVGTYKNTGAGWIPNYPWYGSFDGQGHTVSNVVESGTNSGLFCYIASGGVVKNVNFINATLSGNSGIIATSSSGGLVEKVFVYGKIIGLEGGSGIPPSMLVSKNEGTISNCVVIVDESSLTQYGAMLAGTNSATVRDCVAINLSSRALYGVGTAVSAGIASAGECGVKNVFGHSYSNYELYVQESADYSYDNWATELIQRVIDANKGSSLNVSEIPQGASANLYVKNLRFVAEYSSDNEKVTVQNAKISVADDAVIKSVVTVKVRYIDGEIDTFSFTVIKGAIRVKTVTEIDVRNDKYVINLKDENFVGAKVSVPGTTVKSATFGTTVLSGITIESGKLTIPTSAVGNGADDWGNIEISVRTNTETFIIPLFVYISISQADDLATMYLYAHTTGKVIDKAYGGQNMYAYIRLNCDIDMEYYNFSGGYYSGSQQAWTTIFHGTFDGNGYAIKNWVPQVSANNGLIPCIAPDGVVKNLKIIHSECNDSSMICTYSDGLIENVLIEGVINHGGPSYAPVGMIVGKNNGRVVSCVVICNKSPKPQESYGAMIAGRNQAAGKVENCLAINLTGNVIYAVGTDSSFVADSIERANSTNYIFSSWEQYDASKQDLQVCQWAKDYIESLR